MKQHLNLGIAILTITTFLSCKSQGKFDETYNNTITVYKEDKTSQHWSYKGETSPEHWADIEKNSDCNGNYQSPVNIIDIDSRFDISDSLKLRLKYNSETIIHDVRNNGHSIQFDFEPGDAIIYKNKLFNLNQIHFHEPSEHTIDGIRFPIEIHLVHSNNTGELAVISILGKEGKANNPVDFLELYLPIENQEIKYIGKPFDLNSIFPVKSQEFYAYKGSLTTPPCSEIVNWIVFKQPIILSLNQVLKLKNNMPLNNYRNEQPLNKRMVYKNFK